MTVATFEGKRTIDGLVVTVDGDRLDEHYDVQQFTTWGFEWTYEGDSPKQLALALLLEHLRDKARNEARRPFHAQGGSQPRQRLGAAEQRHRPRDPRHRVEITICRIRQSRAVPALAGEIFLIYQTVAEGL
jgi:hypothetical protein